MVEVIQTSHKDVHFKMSIISYLRFISFLILVPYLFFYIHIYIRLDVEIMNKMEKKRGGIE